MIGIVDLRDLVLSPDNTPLNDLMATSVVAADEDTTRDDLEELFAKYHHRMMPVVDIQDRLLGVVQYDDIVREGVSRAKA